MSTGLEQISEANRRLGLTVEPIIVPVKRLATLSSAFVDKTVHWMKIDVEGMEERVLEGWDPRTLRPWIIVIEATLPNSRETNSGPWEHLLSEANYQFVYFDGLNRFYVASEHPELKASFGSPVNIFDAMDGCRLTQANLFVLDVAAELLEARQALAITQGRLVWMKRSLSWRITQPLRDILSLVRRAISTVSGRRAGQMTKKGQA